MNKTLRTLIIVIAVLVIAGGLVGAGIFVGRAVLGRSGFNHAGMMGVFNRNNRDSRLGYGMMEKQNGHGMMGGQGTCQDDGDQCPFEHDMMGGGMMGGGMMGGGMMGGGMMGGFSSSTDAEPLSAEDSLTAVEAYLADLGNDDLVVDEIMVFDNNSYAVVKEQSTGVGAFELLIDPATKNVFPEVGPNMMWNLKYGMHAGTEFGGHGMMGGGMMGGGMMGGGMMGDYGYEFSGELPDVSSEMTVDADQALELAQNYLDAHQPGVTVSDEITAFYGYYTIDLEKDSAIVGMLSVNGMNGQVFPHTWHGAFIDMLEVEHE